MKPTVVVASESAYAARAERDKEIERAAECVKEVDRAVRGYRRRVETGEWPTFEVPRERAAA